MNNILAKIVVTFFVFLIFGSLISCDYPPPTQPAPPPLPSKRIEAQILRGESVGETDLKGLSTEELRRLRNTVFAKYGKVFKKPGLGDYFAACDWYKPNPNYKDYDANKLLTATDKQTVEVIQRLEESAKLANTTPSPTISISESNSDSKRPDEINQNVPAAAANAPLPETTYGNKTVTTEEIRNILLNSPNTIAAESNLETALGNRQITIKSFNISMILRNDDGDPVMMDSGFPFLIVRFTEDQKQVFSSISSGDTLNIKCKYLGLDKGRIFFSFESF